MQLLIPRAPAHRTAAHGAARMEADLRVGEWDHRHGHLRQLDQLDVSHRLVTADT